MKKVLSLMLAAVMLMSLLTACGGSSDPAKANPDAPQTEFKVVSGISALSGGYDTLHPLFTTLHRYVVRSLPALPFLHRKGNKNIQYNRCIE